MNKCIKMMAISLLLILSMPISKLSAQVSVWDGTWEPWTHGTGTEADPFLIENAQQLAYLAYRVNNGLDAGGGHVSNHDYHYKLMVDVDLNGSENFQWTPIGYWNSNTDYQCFGGCFDGNGHTVLNLFINSNAFRVGFFGFIDGTTIKNLGISGDNVATTGQYAGGIVGYANGETFIHNCSNAVNIDCHNSSSVCISGGLIGTANTITITNSCNLGNVISSNTNYSCVSGGIIGHTLYDIRIVNCYNNGNIYSNNNNNNSTSGGILGSGGSIVFVSNCYNTGNINGRLCGGISGTTINGTNGGVNSITRDCYNIGTITGSIKGGIQGSGYIGGVINSYYLSSCGGNNNYGGQPMSFEAMQSQEFVAVLNCGLCTWEYDFNNTNSGYPLLTMVLVMATTLDATDVTQSHSTLYGIIDITNASVQSQGFEYKEITNPTWQTINVPFGSSITYTLSNLTPNTQYIFRTFISIDDCGTFYGEEKTFTTQQISPITTNATNVTQTHATLNGSLNVGDANIVSQGFLYRKTTDYAIQTVEVSGNGSVSTTITDLTPNTNYLFCAFCTPQEGNAIYGHEMYFITLTLIATTYPASNITESSVTLNGSIDVGDAVVTDKGFKFWPANDPQNVSTVSVSTTGNISATINNLSQNTYQYRAFVESNDYTYQGNIHEFEISWLNNDTIHINNADKLRWVSEQCNSGFTFEGKCVKLMNDITLPLNVPNNMTSIGSYPDYPFKGTFDGNGKLITNLYIDQPNTPYQGFFGYTLNANLYNVGLVNITASGRNYTGGMVAYAANTYMRDCYVNGGTLFALSYCGGLVGYQEQGTNSIISGCYNTCEVTGNNYVGGLIGFSNYSTVRNSYVAGRVAAQGEPVGAIIGGANEVLMYYCYFSTELTGQTNAIGWNNFKDGEGMTNAQMRDPQFVNTLNQNLVTPVWMADYTNHINNGFPIINWQRPGTGVEEHDAAKQFVSIYPNPANGFVTIKSDDLSVSLKQLDVYDVTGRKVMTEVLDEQNQEISIAKLVSGVYHLRVQTSNGYYTNLKLIVQ